jgi:hypothetical protein
MQKFLKVLERNVEWIAVGLGALFLLWMAWSYAFNEPAVVKVGTGPSAKTLGPDNIDEEIYNTQGKTLSQDMNRTDKIDMPINDVLTPYLAKLEEKDAKEPQIAALISGTRGELPGAGGELNIQNNKVAQLPKLPAPVFVNESHDITTIMLENANGNANANANGGGGAAVQPVANTKDTDWVSLRFKVDMPKVGDAFKEAFGKTDMELLFITRFLQVELIRQEKLPNGQWSQPTTVPSLGADGAFPGDAPDAAARQAAAEYKSAAGNLQKQILTPAFPKVMDTAPAWYAPGAQPGAPAPKQQAAPIRPIAPAINPNAGANNGMPQQLAPGDVNVLQANNEKEIVVHDLTAQDGKTYRYAVRYKLSNPVWDSSNLAAPELTRQFALVSPQSEWSKEITVPPHTRLFVTNVNGSAGRVTFQLYEYKNGKYEEKRVDGTPGDSIKDWTVVDVRKDSSKGDSYALMLEGNGGLTKHTKKTDQEGYDQFKALTAPRQAALAK